MIVVVGTCAAIFIQTPLEVMQRALKIFPWIIRPPVRDGRLLIAKIVEWSNIAATGTSRARDDDRTGAGRLRPEGAAARR